jgi:hypothetical protein
MSDDWYPVDDGEFDDIEASNRIVRERMERERAEAEAHERRVASVTGQITEWLRAGRGGFQAFPNATVEVIPRGVMIAPSVRAARMRGDHIEAGEWKPDQMRFWDGFPPACDPSPDALRLAGADLVGEFGSFAAVLALCAPETRSRWQRVTKGFSGSEGGAQALWGAILARGMTAIRSEARYRRKQTS